MKLESILSEELTDFKQKRRVLSTLSTTDIKLQEFNSRQQLTTEKLVKVQDISGSALSKVKNQDTSAYLTIYTYVKSKNGKRQRDELVLQFNKHDTHEKNVEHARLWDKEIKVVLKSVQNVEDHRKPLLIFVNPKSGAGKAKNIFYERSLAILNEANMPHVLVLTGKFNTSLSY